MTCSHAGTARRRHRWRRRLARADATPAAEEITRIRHLINRIKGDLAHLPGVIERARTGEAVTIIRKHRAVSLGMPAVRTRTPAPRYQALT